MNHLSQYPIEGTSAVKIAESVEAGIRSGTLGPGEKLPPIRNLAEHLGVSPATVASAYQSLHQRGVLIAQGRRGTRVAHRPLHGTSCAVEAPPGVRNLSTGNPDPALLPPFREVLAGLDVEPQLYGNPTRDLELVELVSRDMNSDGVAVGDVCITNGAMDAMERVLAEHLRPGDRVAMEDPGFGSLFNLVMSRGLSIVPVPVDDEGITPEGLADALSQNVSAVIVSPRSQNPRGGYFTIERVRALRRLLDRNPDVLIIEDDHAAHISGVDLVPLHDAERSRWVYVRSFSKALNPDLRLAVMTGDEKTICRINDGMFVGCRWVSHILQRITYELLSDQSVRTTFERACATYTARRIALKRELAALGLTVHCPSGFNMWVPVPEETPVVQKMVSAGFLVAAGERFRVQSDSGIRVTFASLEESEAPAVARAVLDAIAPRRQAAYA